MNTHTFPATDILMPSDEWVMGSLKINRAFSEETTCFQAKMTHVPTKRSFYIKNDGRGGGNMYDGDPKKSRDERNALFSDWSLFVASCKDALKQSVAHESEEWLRTLYDNKDYTGQEFSGMESDSVISLFLNEMDNQGMFSRKRGLVVRTPESWKVGSFSVYSNTTPADLAGKVADGEYWDKKAKNWVSL